MTLPRPLAPFLGFAQALRAAGHLAAPEQTQAFIAAVGLIGPRSLMDVRRAAHATFGPTLERREEFDALFDEIFLGRVLTAPALGEPEDMPNAFDASMFEPMFAPEDEEASGADASIAERLFARRFVDDEAAALRAFSRSLPHALPRRRARRTTRGKGRMADPRRTFRQMMRRDGEVGSLLRRMRKQRQRRVLLLIDISGSMKSGTEGALRLAHALVQAGEQVEVFTIGTRLTRVTRALARRNREQALEFASGLVADWDGGTRLGEALQVFLSVPRFASFARGAMVVVLSDGLERGGPQALSQAMTRLHGLAWSVLWLTPLAVDAQFQPKTEALRAITPMIDRLGNGSSPQAIAHEILHFAKGGAPMRVVDAHFHIWRQADLPWLVGPMQPRIFGPYEAIRRDYPMSEYRAEASAAGVERSVYVQANWPVDRAEAEVAWVETVAHETGWPHAIVGYADMTVADVRPALDRLARYPRVRGVRQQFHWHENPLYRFAADPDLCRAPAVQTNVARLADYGWSFDLQVFASQMPGAAELARACPQVSFILQHAGMLTDASPAARATWRDNIAILADEPNVYAKLSGFGTFIHRNDADHIAHLIRDTVAAFGPQRCLWGSNFPIEKLWTDYASLIAAHRRGVDALGEDAAAAAIFHDTASRVYRL